MVELYRFREIENTGSLRKKLTQKLCSLYGRKSEIVLNAVNTAISYVLEALRRKGSQEKMRVNNEGQPLRLCGEPYINHALRVALIMCGTELNVPHQVILAAILHDVGDDPFFADSDPSLVFGDSVASVLRSVKAISDSERMYLASSADDAVKNKIFAHKPLFQPWAMLIKFASRYDNLLTAGALGDEARYALIRNTEKFILPLIRNAGAGLFEEVIEEELFRIGQKLRKQRGYPDLYEDLKKKTAALNALSSVRQTVNLLESALVYDEFNEKYSADASDFLSFELMPLNMYEVYERMRADEITDVRHLMPSSYINRILVSSRVQGSIAAVDFFKALSSNPALRDLGITKIDGNVILFSDKYLIKYEAVFLRKDESDAYLFGQTTYDKEVFGKEAVTVYSHDGIPVSLPPRSTVIDYAFHADGVNALRLKAAFIDDKPVAVVRSLAPNNRIRAVYDDYPCAKVGWLFNCVTDLAKKELIDYFDTVTERLRARMEELKGQNSASGENKGIDYEELKHILTDYDP